ncbi:MAG: adenosylmethionine-8-amino-7-oxononanoate aminotransferase [Chloroflexi bacterium]|nr:MAG: adenosylmethionine-8-amino-7-oxononanoate aminotransferase [Chloroflexota bacterium]
MALFDAEPEIVVERGEANRLFTTDGRSFIDGVSSLWCNVHGHGRAEIVQAIQEQASVLQHSTLLGVSHTRAIELAERLPSILPVGLTRSFFSENGASAVEVALKMAVQFWRNAGKPERQRIVALEFAYHGDTIGGVSLGAPGKFRDPYAPLLFEPLRFDSPYAFGMEPGTTLAQATQRSLESLRSLLDEHAQETAAVIIEPRVQGAGGMIVSGEGHLAGVRRLCDEFEVLLIADEVATGFGRTGEMFACNLEQITPDIATLGKGITGGYLPLSATVTTEQVYANFYDENNERTFYHGHTYAGNPICAAAALANLDVFANEDVIGRVQQRAALLESLLQERFGDHPQVGEVRQQGLMVGIELVADRDSRTPFPAAERIGAGVCMAAREHEVLLRPLGDVVILMPPLSIEEDELAQICEAVAHGLDAIPGALLSG